VIFTIAFSADAEGVAAPSHLLAMTAATPIGAGRAAEGPVALVIEADDVARGFVSRALERDGIVVAGAGTGSTALRALFDARPQVIVLGLRVADPGGWGVLDRIREVCDVPVIVVADQAGEPGAVRALHAGADDFLPEPYGMPELQARIAALLRRGRRSEDSRPDTFYSDGQVEIDANNVEARALGRPLHLTPLELRLLMTFVEHPNQTLSTQQLLDRVWGDHMLGSDRVKLVVGYLRGKFRAQGVEPPIETKRGFGYRYVVPER
jgi:DNA-binding response OmpR family regulator